MKQSLYLILAATVAVGSPAGTSSNLPTKVLTTSQPSATAKAYDWSSGWEASFPIHPSCNTTLRNQLQEALDETVQLAQHARNHILRFGSKSEFVKKYFGNSSTAEPIGWFDRIVAADKAAMLFRCDDPDRNCATQKGWAGHWRGSNATTETVICARSFEVRRPLSAVCNSGYTVSESPLNTYWAVDLLHRLFHVPTISENVVDHFAHGYGEVLELAKTQPKKSTIDTDALQYFAIDVWAYDIAAPGVGCSGKVPVASPTKKVASETQSPTSTKSADKSCHTHADGALHCV